MNTNPLSKYFRQVKTYIAIPSSKFIRDDSVVAFSNDRKEVSIKAMTAVDEVALKNPDALLNGEALAQVLTSCVEEIKDPFKMYINDVNVLMAAIKCASSGKDHPISVECPKCKHENNFNLDLEALIQQTTFLEPEYVVELMGLKIYVNPFTLRSQINAMSLGFEESKTFKMLQDADDVEDTKKIKAISQAIRKMAALNFDMIADSVTKVITADGEVVTDRNHIAQFVKGIEKDQTKAIEKKIEEINKVGLPQTIGMTCTSCEHTWDSPLHFDPTTFFTNT